MKNRICLDSQKQKPVPEQPTACGRSVSDFSALLAATTTIVSNFCYCWTNIGGRFFLKPTKPRWRRVLNLSFKIYPNFSFRPQPQINLNLPPVKSTQLIHKTPYKEETKLSFPWPWRPCSWTHIETTFSRGANQVQTNKSLIFMYPQWTNMWPWLSAYWATPKLPASPCTLAPATYPRTMTVKPAQAPAGSYFSSSWISQIQSPHLHILTAKPKMKLMQWP